ncbi:MAG TPA: hemerythrin domain-containing protein [Methanomassiliicoccales archaeon]
MPSGFELYKNIHKGQRFEMFRISDLAGQAEPEDPESLTRLSARIAAFRDELRNHAHTEETYVHPILAQRVPGGARKLEQDHTVMHRQLDDLVAMTETMMSNKSIPSTEGKALFQELYLAWNRFVAFYLEHIDYEEEQAQPELWRLCSDEEVKGIFGHIIGSEAPEMLAFDLGIMLPAVSRGERVEMVRALDNAPPEMMKMFSGISQKVLSPEDYEDLRSRGGLP